jgi:exosortase
VSLSGHPEVLGAARAEVRLAGLAWFGLAVLASLPMFWLGFERLAQEWARPEFRFKAVVPLFSLMLFLQVLRTVPPGTQALRGRWLGAVLVVGALLLAIFGTLINIDDFVFMAIVAWVAGMIVVGFGLPRGLAFWAPVASLFLMVPLPRFVVAPIHHVLESLASELAMGLLRVVGIPARVEGLILDFGIHRLPLAEATAGLVSFLPVMLVFFFFATVYRGPLWSRLMPLVLAAPLMVALISLRMVMLGVAVDRSGAAGAERVLALAGDWAFLGACIAILAALVLGAQWLAGDRSPVLGRFDVDLAGLGAQVGRLVTIRPSTSLIAVALISAALAAVVTIGPSRPPAEFERVALGRFPPDIGDWHGHASTITD